MLSRNGEGGRGRRPGRGCGPNLQQARNERKKGWRLMTMPRVLVSDKLSKTAVQIFKDRRVEVDYQPDLGKDKDTLLAIIGDYDGLAIRSATKVTAKLLAAGSRLKVIGRAGIG